VLDEDEAFENVVPYPDQVVQRVAAYSAHIQENFPQRKILGIGIAAPGFTEPGSGEIVSIGRVSGWQNFPILQKLSTLLNVLAFIANDVDCMAFAEFQHTGISFDKNLAYVGFDEGVKISMFLQGQLYKGSLGNAGLIATDLLNLNAVHDDTTHDNILTIHGINHLVERRIKSLDETEQASYAKILSAKSHRKRFKRILEGAVAGLPACQEVTQSMNTALAVAIANFVYLVQPDQVVIGGLLGTMPSSVYSDLKTIIHDCLPRLFANRLIIQQALLTGENTAALGATYHFLEAFLHDLSTESFHRIVLNTG
jgi:glucokinase